MHSQTTIPINTIQYNETKKKTFNRSHPKQLGVKITIDLELFGVLEPAKLEFSSGIYEMSFWTNK
jgi:hypothetical protein